MSWGISVRVSRTDDNLETTFAEAVARHFDESDRAADRMERRAASFREVEDMHPDDIAEADDAAAFVRGSSAAGREQALSAVSAAVALVRAQHIFPVTVSITGEANPDHAITHERGLPARIVVALVADL